MIVIEGKAGKSKVLQEIIFNLNENVIVLDSVGVKGLRVPEGSIHYMVNSDLLNLNPHDFPDLIKVRELVEEVLKYRPEFKWIALEFNTHPSFIAIYKHIEEKCGVNVILTVQNDTADTEVFDF